MAYASVLTSCECFCVQGQTSDALFDALVTAQVQSAVALSLYVALPCHGSLRPKSHRPPVDKKFAGPTFGPSSRSSSLALLLYCTFFEEKSRMQNRSSIGR